VSHSCRQGRDRRRHLASKVWFRFPYREGPLPLSASFVSRVWVLLGPPNSSRSERIPSGILSRFTPCRVCVDTTHATLTTLHTRCEVGVRRDGTKALFSGGFRQGLRLLRDRATDGHKSPALSKEDAQGLLAAHTLPWRKSTSVRRGNGNHEWARHLEFPCGFSRGHAQRQNCPLSFVTES